MKIINILIVDDHAMFRDGLKLIIQINTNYNVIGEAGDGREALEKADLLKPDLIILDISMPGTTGIEVACQIRKYHPNTKIVMLSRHDNEEYVNHLMSYGVHGYVLKDNASEDLLRAIVEVLKGNIFVSPEMMKKVLTGRVHENGQPDSNKESIFSILTRREIEILKYVAEGKTSIMTAQLLRISEKTINVHRMNIMRKLNIHKATDLVKYAIRSGLIEY